MKTYDVIVIGAGGGTKISTPASHLGKKVAIIEKFKLGGTCLNRGCIPSKMLIHPANVASLIKDTQKFDMKAQYTSVNFAKLVHRINSTTDGNSNGIEKAYAKNKNLDYYAAHATFVSDKVINVDGKLITAKKIFIATGANPFIPPIPGLADTPYMTSAQALRRRNLPKKLIVIGGGYIACELGHAYGALGSDVHLLVRGNGLLEREDTDVSKEFTKAFSSQNTCHFNVNTDSVSYKNKKFYVTISDARGKKSTMSGDALLVATGVNSNTNLLGLEKTSIKTNKRGFIKVNSYLQTTVKGVYALGDCVGNYMFRHSVNFEGEYLFNSHFSKGKIQPISYPPMPHAVFSSPEVGGVGLSEQELIAKGKKKGKDYVVGLNSYEASAQGMARLSKFGFAKLIFEKKSKKLIGAHIVGDEASVMIHQLIYAITFGAKIDDLLKMIYIHPALPEIVRNAARKAKEEF